MGVVRTETPRFGRTERNGPMGRNIDFVMERWRRHLGSDDVQYWVYSTVAIDTNKTYLAQFLNKFRKDGLTAIFYSDENTPFIGKDGVSKEKLLWVSNQTAHDLMVKGILPPATSDPRTTRIYEMIDAQLTDWDLWAFLPLHDQKCTGIAELPTFRLPLVQCTMGCRFLC